MKRNVCILFTQSSRGQLWTLSALTFDTKMVSLTVLGSRLSWVSTCGVSNMRAFCSLSACRLYLSLYRLSWFLRENKGKMGWLGITRFEDFKDVSMCCFWQFATLSLEHYYFNPPTNRPFKTIQNFHFQKCPLVLYTHGDTIWTVLVASCTTIQIHSNGFRGSIDSPLRSIHPRFDHPAGWICVRYKSYYYIIIKY